MPFTEFTNPHILRTKLYRPPITPDVEQRIRLLDHLNHNIRRPLTLISAPAGYGKTVLVSQWLESCDCPNAWLSVDESDNDLGVFISYLLTAISNTFPDLAFRSLNLMAVPNLPPVPLLAQTLSNDLVQIDQPFILVLDDIHRIHHPEICELFDMLLQRPPRNLHLVMIGRHDPPFQISSLRARGQVTEIRTLELCFTSDETAWLMRKMLDREVDPVVAADWAKATEGWVTALRLAVLSLRHRGGDDDLRLHVRGDSRYLRDYLLAEVLSRLPKQYQNCLSKIAFLDRFCGPLCDAICQTDALPESNRLTGETFVDWLECENLFLIPLDDQHQWFRFHHLFQEMLMEMLHPYSNSGEIAELRMCASRWFAENGLVSEAIQQALAAGDTEYAVGLVANHRHQLMNQENWIQLQQWLDLFPDEIVVNDPVLAITKSQVYSSYGRYHGLRSQVERQLVDMPSDSPIAKEIRGELAASYALEGVLIGQGAKAIAKSLEALALLPPQAQYHRNNAIGVQSIGYQMSGDSDQGIKIIEETLNDPGLLLKSRSKLLVYRAWLCFMEGDLATALRAAGESLRFAVPHKFLSVICEAQYISGIAYYQRNELALAEQRLLAIVKEPMFSDPAQLAMAACALTRMYQAQHHPEKATDLLQRMIAYLEKIDNMFSLEILHAFQVELSLDQGDPALARRLSLNADFDGFHPFWYHYMIQLTPIKLMLVEGNTASLTRSLDSLVQISEELRRLNRKALHIEVLALLALVHDALGDVSAALDNLTAALRFGEPGGFIRSFVDLGAPMANLLLRSQEQRAGDQHADYIAQILAAFPKIQPSQVRTPQTQIDEALTDREFEVLTLLAQRLSNKEIAEQLSISLDTVKSHTSNIYSKLGVNNRKQAVEKAIELDLLPKG